jgi:hypothetical protein
VGLYTIKYWAIGNPSVWRDVARRHALMKIFNPSSKHTRLHRVLKFFRSRRRTFYDCNVARLKRQRDALASNPSESTPDLMFSSQAM